MIAVGDLVTAELADSPSGFTGTWIAAALDNDGSRRVIGTGVLSGSVASWPNSVQGTLSTYPDNPVVATGPSNLSDLNPKWYLPYPAEGATHLSTQLDPVNQWVFLTEWQAFVARSAHEFDLVLPAHSLEDLTENEAWTVRHQMYGLIAAPWAVMNLLAGIDPTAETDGVPDWKTSQADVEPVLAGLCHECEDLANYARRFAHEANLELFRGALVQGKVYESDRDVTPWGLSDTVVTQVVAPIGTTPTGDKIAQFHRQNRALFLSALKFNDTRLGS